MKKLLITFMAGASLFVATSCSSNNMEIAKYYTAGSAKPDEMITAYEIVAKKSQLILTGGFQHLESLKKYESKLGENQGFIYIDGIVEAKNINSIYFNIEETAFYAGYAAADYLVKNKKTYNKNGLKIGTFGGMNFPAVTGFMAGFQQGVAYWNKTQKTEVEFVKLGTKITDYFSGGFKPGLGKAISEKLLALGADIILPVAGPQTADTLKAIKEKGSNALVIGVDTDQSKQYNNYKSKFLTSILKRMDVAVVNATKHIYGEKNNDIYGLGKVTVGSISNDLTGLAVGGLNKLAQETYDNYKAKIAESAKMATNTFYADPIKKTTKISYKLQKFSLVSGSLITLRPNDKLLKIHHITDGGKLMDKSFNQTIFKGLKDYFGL